MKTPTSHLTTRIIPCLDVDNGRVVKGVKFKDIADAGDPATLAKTYNFQGADEITFLDIGATYKSRKTLLDIVQKVSREVFVPLTVGGGIRTTRDIRQALLAGADKVSICSAAISNPQILTQGANIFGSQCIVLSLDVARVGSTWHAFTAGGRVDSGLDAIEFAKKGEALGAGEILLNSIDADGTKEGYDIPLTKKIVQSVRIPVIASGGAGKPADLKDVVLATNCSAVLLASLLHYGEYTLVEIKDYLRRQALAIR